MAGGGTQLRVELAERGDRELDLVSATEDALPKAGLAARFRGTQGGHDAAAQLERRVSGIPFGFEAFPALNTAADTGGSKRPC